MSAGVELPDPVTQTLEGERRARRLLRCWADRMPMAPDSILDELHDLAIEHGRPFAPSPAMRALLRTIEKHLEGRG